MFYFLLSNSSITKIKDPEKKLLTTFLYGSILYIIFHAILNTSTKPFFQIIKTYYWTILALDIFTLIFYYKETFVNIITKDGVIKKIITTLGSVLQNTFNNIADTSNYSNDVEFETNTTFDSKVEHFDDVQCTLDNLKKKTQELENLQVQNNNTNNTNNKTTNTNNTNQDNKSILKKVSINENKNTSHTIPKEIKELNNNLQKLNQPDNVSSNNLENNQSNNKINNQNNNQSNSSSIQEIRNKQNIDKSKLQLYDNNTLIENRNELSNDELENIKLNYNPNDLLNEIEYETEQKNELLNGNDFLNGNGNSKLDNNDINTIKSTPISKINNIKNKFNTTNSNSEDDKQSQISGVSDLGSVFDFNLDDFENKL